jgi:tape measure domain-containing protein
MAQDGFIEFLSPGALAELKEAHALVLELVKGIDATGVALSKMKTPSAADGGVKGLSKSYKDQEVAIKTSTEALAKYTDNYKKLTQARDVALKKLQDISAKEQLSTKEINKAKAAYDALEAKVKSVYDIVNNTKEKASAKAIALAQKEEERAQKAYDREIARLNKLADKQIAARAKSAERDGRTGASSPIPGIGAKISDIRDQERQLAIAQKMAEPYNKLKVAHQQASNTLRNLIASGTASNAQLRQAQKEFDVLDKKIRKADQAVGNFSRSVGNYRTALNGVTSLMGAFGIATGVFLGASIIKDIYSTTKELQSLDLALKMVSETQKEFGENQAFISKISEKWGLEIKAATNQYTQFYTASKGLLSLSDIQTTFEGIAKAGSVMGLSVDKQSAAFYAIDQMMSKGTITAEELKKQLGNAMPGAIKAMAMAYMELHPQIKSIQEAEKEVYSEMKKGALDSATYVPLLAKAFQRLYGIEQLDRVNTMAAAQNRLANAWTNWIRGATSGSTSLEILVEVTHFLAKNLNAILNVLSLSAISWGAYKAMVMLAAIQTKLVTMATTQATVAQGANTVATNVATAAWIRFKAALSANALGLIITALGVAVYAFQRLSRTALELNRDVEQTNSVFIANRETVSEANIEIKKAIREYEHLTAKAKALGGETKLTTEEQQKLKDVTAALAKEMPAAIRAVDQYGNALKLSTELLKEYVKNTEKIAEAERLRAIRKEEENLNRLKSDEAEKIKLLKQSQRFLTAEQRVKNEGYIQDEANLSVIQNKIILSKERLKQLKATTQAQIDDTNASNGNSEAIEKNVAWYDAEIEKLEKKRKLLTDVTGKEGRAINKEIKELERVRDLILAAEKKAGRKGSREKVHLNFEEAESIHNLRLAILEKQKAENEDDDQTSYESRIQKRLNFSALSIQILDEQLQRERAILDQHRKDDNAKNDVALKNKDITEAEHLKNKADILKTFTNKSLALDEKHSQNYRAIEKADFDFWRTIKYKKADEAIKLENLIRDGEIAKNKEIVDNERFTMLTRQTAFDKFVELEKKKLEVEHVAAIERAKIREASEDEINAMIQSYQNAIDAIDRIKSPMKKGFEEGADYMKKFLDSFWADAKLSTVFDVLNGGLDKFGENWQAKTVMIMEAVQEMYNFIANASKESFNAEYENLEKQKNIALLFAGESASARQEIERQTEGKRREIRKREYEAQKKMALFNIAIDTAQASMAAYASQLMPGNPESIIRAKLAAIVTAALGAVQLGLIASQQVPQFWRGTDDAPEGFAWTQEKGREIITDKHGNVKSMGSDGGAQMTYLNKGDKVFNNEKTMDMLMFNRDLNSILSTNNIGTPKAQVNVNAGMTDAQVSRIVDSISAKESVNMNIDKNGLEVYVRNGHTTKELLNRRINFKGTSV